MVAIIKTGNSLSRSFYYNENKISEGVAECIMAGNYPADAENLTENQRLNMLLKLAAMNENVTRTGPSDASFRTHTIVLRVPAALR